MTGATALSLAFPGGLALTDPEPAPPEPGRVDNGSGGFSYLVPAGMTVSNITNLPYGQALLTKIPAPGTEQALTGTTVEMGRLDPERFPAAKTDNATAATQLASDMGKYFMPLPGTLNGRLDPDAGCGAA